ncbi:uncharacterized mitochondrial protein AtMg00810-like [Vicia villosa]|uniref:uncharacterized mitochondrial protein AtMg00810-like n=1 Tax=Vicia villosa TaxID=3911 RepID=UPI00273BF328|nr:uncharacterized mitochondrial protein AtMg00810-like [Vicia villosa]
MDLCLKEELESVEKNNTWELIDLPKEKKLIGVIWVFKVNANTKGEIIKHKPYLVENGFLQRECLYFEEVYALVFRNENIRLVGDLLITGSNETSISKFKSELMKEFEMTNLGLMTYFLVIEFHKSKKGLLMLQKRYALEILKKFEMEHCNSAITPGEPRLLLLKNEDEKSVNPTQYRRLIGSLRYFCNTWPNLVFNVNIVSGFMEMPKLSHLAEVKRILIYIKGSIACRILFPAANTGKKCNLWSFTNSNWCRDKYD